MKLALSALGKIKLGFHSLQALLVFITICVAIAMDAQQGKANGGGVFYNIMVLFILPSHFYSRVIYSNKLARLSSQSQH
jgi:hypothetical protein